MSFEKAIDMLLKNGNVSIRSERANSFERECNKAKVLWHRGRAIFRGDGSVKSYIYYLNGKSTKYSGLYA